jgi:hypothetical protein
MQYYFKLDGSPYVAAAVVGEVIIMGILVGLKAVYWVLLCL